MKSFPLLSLLFCALFSSGAEVGLETLPWTDASWSWSQDGAVLPKINTNLSGKGKISIGGVPFERGICGHTGFSIVYLLDGTADSFSAMVGLDDERHPKDSGTTADVRFVILTDRQTVFQRSMHLGEKPIPVQVDLRGKTQLELRGEYGKGGFLLQRVAWGNPVIRTSSPEKLRTALERNRKKHMQNLATQPVYPEAPAWKRIRISKINWNGFRNAYRIDNGRIAFTVVPECGGRIMEFGAAGKTSLLKTSVPPAKVRMIRGRSGDSAGGHFMRVQPPTGFHPNDPLVQHGPFRIEFPAEGEVRMTSAESALFQLLYEYRIRIVPDSGRLEITNTLINTAPYERQLGIWSITRLETFALKRVLLSSGQGNRKISQMGDSVKVAETADGIELRINFRLKTPRDFLELRAWPAETELRVESKEGNFLRIRYEGADRSPEGESPIHLYFCERFSEMESHGPTRLLKPGERISLTEKWHANLQQP